MSIEGKEKKSRRLALLIVLLLVSFIIVGIGFLIYATFENIPFDSEISKIYSTTIEPEAQYKITNILSTVSKQETDLEKFWIISNLTSHFIYANNRFSQKDRYSQFSILSLFHYSPDSHYYQDEYGRWFIRRGKYANNINVIGYYEAGRCGESAKIWNYTANRSGIISREVSDPSGYHAWVEIQRGEEWFYVDPTIYPSDNLVFWFNSTNNRNQSQLIWKAARVMAGKDDITHLYPPYGTVKINNIGHYDSLFVRWDDGTGKSFIESYDLHFKPVIEINLTVKNYSISTTGLWTISPITNISVNEGKTIEIDLYEDLKPIRLNKSAINIPSQFF